LALPYHCVGRAFRCHGPHACSSYLTVRKRWAARRLMEVCTGPLTVLVATIESADDMSAPVSLAVLETTTGAGRTAMMQAQSRAFDVSLPVNAPTSSAE